MKLISNLDRQTVAVVENEKPHCPECDAEPVCQAMVSTSRDGALQLVVLECRNCGEQHPIWF